MAMNIGTDYTNYTTNYSKTSVLPEKETKTESAEKAAADGVIYEKSEEKTDKSTYKINRMSAEDRNKIADQLRSEAEQRQQQLVNLVQKTLSGQVNSYGIATEDDIWKTLASGNFTVDPATKAQAQEDISEDGYWGVKQTSQRLFDFASALAGDDVDKMKEMQAAMEKGFKQATKTWGRELPSICSDTINAANQLFEDYYKSKEVITEE